MGVLLCVYFFEWACVCVGVPEFIVCVFIVCVEVCMCVFIVCWPACVCLLCVCVCLLCGRASVSRFRSVCTLTGLSLMVGLDTHR